MQFFHTLKTLSALSILMLTSTLAVAQNDPEWCDPYTQERIEIDGINEQDIDGMAIDVSDQTLIIGFPEWDNSDRRDGAVFIFDRIDNQWELTASIFPEIDSIGFRFGQSVAIENNIAIIGNPTYQYIDRFDGAVFVYVRDQKLQKWAYHTKLFSAPSDIHRREEFGNAVAIEDQTIFVGASQSDGEDEYSGLVYVFAPSLDNQLPNQPQSWDQYQLLSAPDSAGFIYGFGTQIETSNDTMLIGFQDAETDQAALAFVYTLANSANQSKTNFPSWQYQSTLYSDKPTNDSPSNLSLALDNNTIVIGARSYQDPDASERGAGLIFNRSGSDWRHQHTITTPKFYEENQFGRAVDIDEDRIVISSANEDVFNGAQYIFVFRNTGDKWVEETRVSPLPHNKGEYDPFGHPVALSGDHIFAGFDYSEHNDHRPFVFDLFCDYTCHADFNNDDVIDFYDFSIFRNAFIDQDPLADYY